MCFSFAFKHGEESFLLNEADLNTKKLMTSARTLRDTGHVCTDAALHMYIYIYTYAGHNAGQPGNADGADTPSQLTHLA